MQSSCRVVEVVRGAGNAVVLPLTHPMHIRCEDAHIGSDGGDAGRLVWQGCQGGAFERCAAAKATLHETTRAARTGPAFDQYPAVSRSISQGGRPERKLGATLRNITVPRS